MQKDEKTHENNYTDILYDNNKSDICELISSSEIFTPVLGEWKIGEDDYGNIIGNIEIKTFPLMGHTLLHALRRISLGFSNTFTAVLVSVSNNNLQPAHQFDSVEGILEEMPTLHANIKKIKVKLLILSKNKEDININYFFLSLSSQKSGTVYAGDLQLVKNENIPDCVKIEIINKNQEICNLNVGSNFKIEILFRKGFGYASEEDNNKYIQKYSISKKKENFFFLSSNFSNGTISFTGEVTEITGGSIPYDLLTINIKTDGRIEPKTVLSNAFTLLHSQIPLEYRLEGFKTSEVEEKEDYSNININDLEFSPASKHQLIRNNITTLGDLLQNSQISLLSKNGIGAIRVKNIIETLEQIGLSLKEINKDNKDNKDKK